MKLFRMLMLSAGLVAFAQVASAQSLSAVSLHALATQPSDCGGCRFNAIFSTGSGTWTLSAQPCNVECELSQCNWLTQLVQHSMASWQRLCGRGEACCAVGSCPVSACTGAVKACGTAMPVCCAKSATVATSAKCCCAKECACCETCAKAKATAERVVQVCPTPCQTWAPMPTPVATPVRIIPVGPQPVAVPFHFARSAPVMPAQRHQAHFVNADFDVHSDRMTHNGDVILLEGNVRLVRLTQGRHMLVEAERVLFNVRDGSFTVESTTPAQPKTINILRTSAAEPTYPGVTIIPVPAGGLFERVLTEDPATHWSSYYKQRYHVTPSR